MRVCAEPGCPEISDKPRCMTHTRERDRARGSRQERGHGARHEAERKSWAARVGLGLVQCWRCRRLIPGNAAWDMGHCDNDKSIYHGPEHRACNRATAGRARCPHPTHISPAAYG